MTDDQDTLRAGDRARLLIAGRQGSHSVTVETLTVDPNFIECKFELTGKTYIIPSSQIVSVERVNGLDSTTVRLPPPMSEVVAPLRHIFLKGSGALLDLLDIDDLETHERNIRNAFNQSVDDDVRNLLTGMLECLSYEKARISATSFDQSQRAHDRLLEAVALLEQRCSEHQVSPQLASAVSEAAGRLRNISDRAWQRYLSSVAPRPRFIQPDGAVHVVVQESGEAVLPLRLRLDQQFAPATELEIIVRPLQNLHGLSGLDTLHGLTPGRTERIDYRVTVAGGRIRRPTEVTLRAQVQFRGPDRETRSSPMQSLSFVLRPSSDQFRAIRNPYIAYAAGTTVGDPEMFFGRQQLLDEIIAHLRTGAIGMCYAVYGQKRTGKSSLLEQVRRGVDSQPIIVASLSFGSIDRHNITSSFVRTVLEQIRVPLLTELPQHEARVLRDLWPTHEFIDKNPLESFRTAVIGGRRLLSKIPGWAALRFVILVDEFTYLFEILRRNETDAAEVAGLREFMRQWKALLEGQFFSALVLGQDTLPYFTSVFPNEFSNMATRRLSYLALHESHELARDPILKPDGTSRYTGYALDSLHTYTDGHPFFSQIICDRLVQLANRSKRSDFSELDVVQAVESLLSGPEAIDGFKFDCFLTADNTGLITTAEVDGTSTAFAYDDGGELALELLHQIAMLSGQQNGWVKVDELRQLKVATHVLEDLALREVVAKSGDQVRVRVPFFADYLRRL